MLLTHANSLNENTVIYEHLARLSIARSLRKHIACSVRISQNVKAGTHEGACSRSTLLQHAPGAKLPRLHQRFLAKKYVAQQKFCSRVLLPYIKLV